jgi:hypothetical protein
LTRRRRRSGCTAACPIGDEWFEKAICFHPQLDLVATLGGSLTLLVTCYGLREKDEPSLLWFRKLTLTDEQKATLEKAFGE